MKEIILKPGEILFKKGDIDTRFFYVCEGEIELFVFNEKYNSDIVFSKYSVKFPLNKIYHE
jgi:CRP-like cAMP-binding protein